MQDIKLLMDACFVHFILYWELGEFQLEIDYREYIYGYKALLYSVCLNNPSTLLFLFEYLLLTLQGHITIEQKLL